MPDPTEFPEAEQERAKVLLRSLTAPAPPELRANLEEQIRAARRARRRRPRLSVGWAVPSFAAGAAIVAVALILALSGGGRPAPPSLAAATALALRSPTGPAPGQSGAGLDVSSGGITFPYWQATVGWRAVGTRTDTLDGRRVVTVFYTAPHGARVGYTIVGGTPLHVPVAMTVRRNGINFSVLRTGSVRVVTWQRQGHTCVMASRTASPQRLIALATAPV
ncbi:MAG: hypothetical protein ABI323_01235 [Solirubrobacteraceae bacterium]